MCDLLHVDGDGGMENGLCPNRAESASMPTKSRSLVLMNYFGTLPDFATACKHNSKPLMDMLDTCHNSSGGRWANFIAVDFYKVTVSVFTSSIYN